MTADETQNIDGGTRHEVAVIGDDAMTLGFRLSGVRDYALVDGRSQDVFDAQLKRMMDDGRYSIVIVKETQLAHINPKLARRLKENTLPVVIGIPDNTGVGETSRHLEEMMKKTLGIEIRADR